MNLEVVRRVAWSIPFLMGMPSLAAVEVIHVKHFAITEPLAVLAAQKDKLRPEKKNDKGAGNEDLQEPLPRVVTPGGSDSVLQVDNLTLVGTTPGLNCAGVGNGFPGFIITGAPSDTNGAVGATQFVQWVNTSFAVFNKTTGATVMGPVSGNLLFGALPAGSICRTTNSGDPIAQYDKLANRWV